MPYKPLKYKTTKDIKVSSKIHEQVIGQDESLSLIKKAAKQRRNVILIGDPGTGKSLLGQALAELIPNQTLKDILAFHNPADENTPIIRVVPKGQGKEIMNRAKLQVMSSLKNQNIIFFILLILSMVAPWIIRKRYGDIMAAASLIGSMIFLGAFILFSNLSKRVNLLNSQSGNYVPKLLIDNSGKTKSPFIDATGSHAGALLGDVLHDPLQCIPGDQIVHLANGKPIKISTLIDPLLEEGIKDLKEKEQFEVLGGTDTNYCYNPTKVIKVFKRKYEGDLIQIKTRRGYEILTTPNHPLAQLNEKGLIEYVNAANINKLNRVVVPYRLPNYVSLKENPKFLKLLGYILADAYIGNRTIAFKLRRDFKINEITKIIKINGLNPKILKYDKDTYLNINSSSLVKRLLEIGIKKNGKKSIPSFIYELSPEQITLFLAAYISLDGYVNKQGQFEIFSKELIPDLIPLFLKIGIKAKIKQRKDLGFGNGKLQTFIIFNNYYFAKAYYKLTVNPYHKSNLKRYLIQTSNTHITFDDELPITFDILESIRRKTSLSKNQIHEDYYSLNPNLKTSKALTREFLYRVMNRFLTITNGPELFRFKNLAEGSYACDEVVKLQKIPFNGWVYNITTETGNYIINNILTHNSGGLGTPAYERLIPGMIHRANGGVLFIDEMATLSVRSQQEILTAMQEKKYPITGQSERSSGAMTRSEPVPTDFILVAAGNTETVKLMHPALRSRIRGYGYETYMNNDIDDTEENRDKLAIFVAQEVVKDSKIPHFSKEAVEEIIQEARRRAGTSGKLTLHLRDLGGLVRAAGDLAKEESALLVTRDHVFKAKILARTLEQQIADKYIEAKKRYEIIITKGNLIGRVNGLAVIGSGTSFSGIVLPIESEITPGGKKAEIIATGQLGKIAKEAIKNVSATILKYFGEDIKEKYDIFVQFIGTTEGVEGDSASIAVATAIISALERVPIRQDTAMTGSLSIRGEVLAIGGATSKVEAAIDSGISRVIIPKTNEKDVFLSKEKRNKIKIIPVSTIQEVLKESMVWQGKEHILKRLKNKN